jgi:hypothetical protein
LIKLLEFLGLVKKNVGGWRSAPLEVGGNLGFVELIKKEPNGFSATGLFSLTYYLINLLLTVSELN